MKTSLVIGDSHTIADDPDLVRFDVLGRLIGDRKPDNIIQMGDFFTFDSISSHNFGKALTMEGQRFAKEIDAGRSAFSRLMLHIGTLNAKRRKNKEAYYRPGMLWLLGNHEFRQQVYVEQHPEMEGVVDFRAAFWPEAHGWDVVRYRDYCEVEGVLFTHIPMNGMNRPHSAKHLTKNIIREHDKPVVYAHTHRLGYESDSFRSGNADRRGTALNCGCYFENIPEYAAGGLATGSWWSGVCLLHHLDDEGNYDLETISLSRLRRMYNDG